MKTQNNTSSTCNLTEIFLPTSCTKLPLPKLKSTNYKPLNYRLNDHTKSRKERREKEMERNDEHEERTGEERIGDSQFKFAVPKQFRTLRGMSAVKRRLDRTCLRKNLHERKNP